MKRGILGIILAGGSSSRLYPATLVSTKQVLPIYDKPLIYYPLTTLMLAGIRDFMIVSTPKERPVFEELFFDAPHLLGINIRFAEQPHPLGIADVFNVVRRELEEEEPYNRYALILGDNIFHGASLSLSLAEAVNDNDAVIFATHVNDPERFGVVELDEFGMVVSLEEKPENPKSDLAVTGLYFYPDDVLEVVETLKPSKRGELEITDLNKLYAEVGALSCITLLRGMIWFDTGTPDSLMEAATMIQLIQKHQDQLVGSPHEVAYNSGWILDDDLRATAGLCEKSNYGKYLLRMLK